MNGDGTAALVGCLAADGTQTSTTEWWTCGEAQICGFAEVVFTVDTATYTANGGDDTNLRLSGSWHGWEGFQDYHLMTETDTEGVFTQTQYFVVGEYLFKPNIGNFEVVANAPGTCAGQIDDINGNPYGVTIAATDINTTVDVGSICFANGEAGCAGDACGGDNGNDSGDDVSTALLNLSFDNADSASSWTEVADATSDEGSIAWTEDAGNPGGALSMSGLNATEIGRAYIFQYSDGAFSYGGASSATLTFDLKASGALVGTALHLQYEVPGAGTINVFDLQNQGLNDATWTSYSIDITGITGDGILRVHFNMAAGAFSGAGGTVLLDNLVVSASDG